jgi:hypothetical protein
MAGASKLEKRIDTVILLGGETKQSVQHVLQQALEYFGPDGLGLEVTYQDAATVQLRGGGGYVDVRAEAQAGADMTAVEIESREWEQQAEQFLGEI